MMIDHNDVESRGRKLMDEIADLLTILCLSSELWTSESTYDFTAVRNRALTRLNAILEAVETITVDAKP
jgi:hypothetical protein